MTTEIPDLDQKELRHFGLVFAGIVAGLFGVVIPLLFGLTYPVWPWVIGALFAVWAFLAPGTMKWFYRLWMRFGLIMNAVMSRIILGVVYYLTVVPTGLIMRMLGKDPMRRKADRALETYRVESETREKTHMRKPF